jgi:hypothetical protein
MAQLALDEARIAVRMSHDFSPLVWRECRKGSANLRGKVTFSKCSLEIQRLRNRYSFSSYELGACGTPVGVRIEMLTHPVTHVVDQATAETPKNSH